MKCNLKHCGTIVGLVLLLVLYCEYLIYYVVLWQCQWPELALDRDHQDKVNAFFVSDPHLLGSRLGHWFDKLRREWQMHRGFVSAKQIFGPEVVFFLGDLFDEGKWSPPEEFSSTVERFHSLFPFEPKIILVGNHDIGFHYSVTGYKRKRFYTAFGIDDTSGVRRFSIKNVHFILVDSLAMHGDQCYFCAPAMKRVKVVSKQLHCMKYKSDQCDKLTYPDSEYSKPILLQHFPLFRKNDEDCHDDPDVLTDPKEKSKPFEPKFDCLSQDSTEYLLETIRPRLVLSGHTHHGCRILHTLKDGAKVPEWSVASFSWRNRNNPVIILGTFTQDEFVLSKCFLPHESTVLNIYIGGITLITVYAIITRRKFRRRF